MRNLLKNFLLVVMGIVFAFVLLEVLLRMVGNPFGFRIKGDEIILPVHRQYEIHNTEIDELDEYIFHQKNSLGFRGAEPAEDFESYLSIIAIGGSTTECFYLSEGQTWIDQLGLKLGENFSPFWINNAGLDGHSTYGHNILLDDYISKLQPHVAIFLVGANDMGLEKIGVEDSRVQVNSLNLLGLIKSASKYSEVVALSFNLARFFATQDKELAHGDFDLSSLPQLELSQAEREKEIEYHRQNFLAPYEERLVALVTKSREIGIEPVLITQPALYGFGFDPLTGIDLARISVRDVDGETQWAILELYNGVTKQVGHQNDVHVIDLANQLPKDSAYYYDALHFTPQGAEQVAEIIYAELCPLLAVQFDNFQSSDCAE